MHYLDGPVHCIGSGLSWIVTTNGIKNSRLVTNSHARLKEWLLFSFGGVLFFLLFFSVKQTNWFHTIVLKIFVDRSVYVSSVFPLVITLLSKVKRTNRAGLFFPLGPKLSWTFTTNRIKNNCQMSSILRCWLAGILVYWCPQDGCCGVCPEGGYNGRRDLAMDSFMTSSYNNIITRKSLFGV